MSFSLDIAKYAKKQKESLEKTARVIKFKLFSGVIMDTRVDTGRLRGNWQTTAEKPASGTVEAEDNITKGEPGGAAYNDAKNVQGIGVDYLTNNLPYAEVYENKDGMIAKNIVRIERNIKEAINN